MRETYFDYKQESLDALAKMDKATRKELLEWCEKSFKPIKSINKNGNLNINNP